MMLTLKYCDDLALFTKRDILSSVRILSSLALYLRLNIQQNRSYLCVPF
jgi:hypothetical protein